MRQKLSDYRRRAHAITREMQEAAYRELLDRLRSGLGALEMGEEEMRRIAVETLARSISR